jgi:hypothetical protein
LTILEENLRRLESGEITFNNCHIINLRAEKLNHYFISARDTVLHDLYSSVRDRFIEFYRFLHSPDEDLFTAELTPANAALDLTVNFHDRGLHSPQALHSEGHQDSMGLCLYLSLMERLTSGLVDLVILDDVVMSVDAMHRRALCGLLGKYFSDKQLIITTHDEVWADQLRTEGLVTSRQRIEFFDWDIDSGPKMANEVDLWQRIEAELDVGNVPTAAGLLRRGSENFFSICCELLRAKVVYKTSNRYDLGDFLPSAYSQLQRHISQGMKSAQSWGNQEKFEWLKEYSTKLKEAYVLTNAEQWAINQNVHFTHWKQMNKNDFLPVVSAFKSLFSLFECNNCEGFVMVVMRGLDSIGIQCKCRNFDWNLLAKV